MSRSEGWQYNSLVDFQFGVNIDSISLSDICAESSKCHTDFCNSGSDITINVHCSRESASQVGEFINNFQFPSIHSGSWFIVRYSGAGWCTTSVLVFKIFVLLAPYVCYHIFN